MAAVCIGGIDKIGCVLHLMAEFRVPGLRVPVPVLPVALSRTGMQNVLQQGLRRVPRDADKSME